MGNARKEQGAGTTSQLAPSASSHRHLAPGPVSLSLPSHDLSFVWPRSSIAERESLVVLAPHASNLQNHAMIDKSCNLYLLRVFQPNSRSKTLSRLFTEPIPCPARLQHLM